VTADIVESVVGAIYMDSGLEHGMGAVMHILSPMFRVLQQIYERNGNIMMQHPRKALQEAGGRCLQLTITKEEEFACKKPVTRVWLGKRWGFVRRDGNRFVGSVECFGLCVVAVVDLSSEVAGNRACAFTVALLNRHPDLLARVQAARAKVESLSSPQAMEETTFKGLGGESEESKSGEDTLRRQTAMRTFEFPESTAGDVDDVVETLVPEFPP